MSMFNDREDPFEQIKNFYYFTIGGHNTPGSITLCPASNSSVLFTGDTEELLQVAQGKGIIKTLEVHCPTCNARLIATSGDVNTVERTIYVREIHR